MISNTNNFINLDYKAEIEPDYSTDHGKQYSQTVWCKEGMWANGYIQKVHEYINPS